MSFNNTRYVKNKIEKAICYICNYEYDYFLSKRNVVGLGLGFKIKGGLYTKQLCIQVFVAKKFSLNNLNSQDFIPYIYKGLPTDIVETGYFISSSLTETVRPVLGGYVIGNQYEPDSSGTLGCLVTNGKDLFILSNNHTIASTNKAPIFNKIIQCSFNFGGDFKTDVIAILSKYIPIKFEGILKTPSNYVDCALGKILNKSLVSPKIALIGNPREISVPILGEEVKKVGFKTELTTGKITNLNSTMRVRYSDVSKVAIFKNQIITTKMSISGDSGSILLNKNNHVLGLNFGLDNIGSVFNPIDLVLKQLDVHLVTSKNFL